MLIAGIQKLTLLDYPGRVACTVFTAGCNFRCPFCHNATLVLPERINYDQNSEESVLRFLKTRQGVLDGVAITGGEPLIHRDIGDFIHKIREMGYAIKLDTNGSFPDELKALVKDKLVDRVAMDIKNNPQMYGQTVGLDSLNLSAIRKSVDFLLSGEVEYEFRTTVVKGLHTKDSLVETAKWIQGASEYYLQQFRDSGNLVGAVDFTSFSENEMSDILNAVLPIIPQTKLRGIPGT